MCIGKKNIDQPAPAEETFPRYLSNAPKGVDLYKGESQQRLADAIAMHITETDKVEKPVFSRLIGLEGKWGSGKSNVIKILEDKLKEKYTFFTFDAWGNQEDLQRRSILELLTRHLILNGKLTGKTTMRVFNREENGKIEEEECTWIQKLESLLSRKSYSREVSMPSVNGWTKTFVLMLLVTGLLIPLVDLVKPETFCWWASLLIVILPLSVFLIIAWRKKKLPEMWKMYNTDGKSDTTSYVISEQEPSVREFKDWMNELSKGIPADEKLVLVFDNMDRLTSEKVHQFWSLIQTFFADVEEGYKNIWCVVPYDEGHLASVFAGDDEEENNIKLLRGYLNKTFSVLYRVPEPIVADYKMVFEELFRQAFGNTVSDNNVEIISQCYRQSHPAPNVREIISFINNNVMLAKQWGDTISPISRAVYVLKADAMLRNPQMISVDIDEPENKKIVKISTDQYLLANEYRNDFTHFLSGTIDLATMQREIAALVYGIDPKDADQIVVKRYIGDCISGVYKDASLAKYVDNPHFMLLLHDDVIKMEESDYKKAAPLINDIDAEKFNDEDKMRLSNIWRFLAERFISKGEKVDKYGEYEHLVFSHVDDSLAELCVKAFCQRIISNKEVNGAKLYEQLTAVFAEDYTEGYDVSKVCPKSNLDAKRFAEYVNSAGTEYKRFPLTANPDELNKVLENAIGKKFQYSEVLKQLKSVSEYKVSEVGDYAVKQLNLKQADALTAANLISVQRIFFMKFQSKLDSNYIGKLWQEVQTEEARSAYDEIYTLKSIGVFENLPDDDKHIDILMKRVLFYTSTAKLFEDYHANLSINFRRNLVKKMLTTNVHDGQPDYPEFVERWSEMTSNLGIKKEVIVRFADSWGYTDIEEQKKATSYFNLLPDVAWIDTLLADKTPLSNAMLIKCVNDMARQPVTEYVINNTANHTGSTYDKALQKLVSTEYVTPTSFGLMANIAELLLDFAAKSGPITDATWLALLAKVSYSSISSKVNEIRNQILIGQSAYAMTPAKFLFLHKWLEQAEINTPDHCTDAANQILAKVVDNAECQNIILSNKEYYCPIIANTAKSASSLHEKLKAIMNKKEDSEFAKYISGMVN